MSNSNDTETSSPPPRVNRFSSFLSPRAALYAGVSALIGIVRAQDSDNDTNIPCNFDLGKVGPNQAFKSDLWLRRGRCIRTGGLQQCYTKLAGVLDALDPVHQLEYSASASVLALLPTIGALFGSPTSEVWTAFRMFPFVGFLTQCLSFGGAIMPSRCDEFLRVGSKQGCATMRVPSRGGAHDGMGMQRVGTFTTSAEKFSAASESIVERVQQLMGPQEARKKPRIGYQNLVLLGFFGLILFLSAVLASMIVVEQGAVYPTSCDGAWWAHTWYIVVTVIALLDSWVNLPFEERWRVYIGREPVTVQSTDALLSESLETTFEANNIFDQMRAASPKAGLETTTTEIEESQLDSTRQMLVIISVSTEEGRSPVWLTITRLLFKAAGITIYVFSTAIFANVSLLALPMVEMLLMAVMAAGLFSRAIAGGLVTAASEDRPMMHVMTNDKRTADEIMMKIMNSQPDEGSTSYVFEVSGKLWVGRNCVRQTKRWKRWFLGSFMNMPSVAGNTKM